MEGEQAYPLQIGKRPGEGSLRQAFPLRQPRAIDVILSNQTKHMVLNATLKTIPVRVMIDCGANCNYASKRLATKLKHLVRDKANVY